MGTNMKGNRDGENERKETLHRSSNGKMIAGVAVGLAEYFHVDVALVRLIFVTITIFGGSGIFLYIALWILLPEDSMNGGIEQKCFQDNVEELKEKVISINQDVRGYADGNRHGKIWGTLIVVLGVLFLLRNFGWWSFVELQRWWPVLMVLLGISVYLKGNK